MWCACVHLVYRKFGGPEEGGWWYDAGDPIPEFEELDAQFFTSRRHAEEFVSVHPLREQNKGMTVTTTGIYEWMITFGMPESYPKEVPHYE
jgi:hypothetical protein